MKLNLKRVSFKTIRDVERQVKASFSKVKEEFEEHLLAINENTDEVSHLQERVEKLGERLDTIACFLKEYGFADGVRKEYTVKSLTNEEKKIFLALYTLEDEKGLVSYSDISSLSSMNEHLVAGYIYSLREKGVDIVLKKINESTFLQINPDFKELQAKENILEIDRAQKQLVHF